MRKHEQQAHVCQIYILYDQQGLIMYVGRTRREIKKRMCEHKHHFGYIPRYEIIDRCSIDCQEIEGKWIAHYQSLGFSLRNISFSEGPHFCAKSTREKLRKINTGRPVTWGVKISAAQKGVKKKWSEEGRKNVVRTQFQPGRSQWAELTPEQQELHRQRSKDQWQDPDLRKKMSKNLTMGRWSNLTDAQKTKRVEKQRATLSKNPNLVAIAKIGAAALLAKHPGHMKRIINKFWQELRNDPERYKEYIQRRTIAIAAARAKAKDHPRTSC